MKKYAFTLAEVLITLGIIGVVAALIIPQLITNYQKFVFGIQLKKSYSVLTTAIMKAEAEYGPADHWWRRGGGHDGDTYDPQLRIIEQLGGSKCNAQQVSKYNAELKQSGGFPSTNVGISDVGCLQMQDGSIIRIGGASAGSGGGYDYAYSSIVIDVNGFKGPNVWMKDYHSFVYIYNGVFYYIEMAEIGRASNASWYQFSTNQKYGLYASGYGKTIGCTKSRDHTCTQKFINDGLEFSKDYAW